MPNTLLNVPKDPAKTRSIHVFHISKEGRRKEFLCKPFPRFFAGDWGSFEELVAPEMLGEEGKFDLILTSETIYNTKNQHKLISIFKNLLKKNGQVSQLGITLCSRL